MAQALNGRRIAILATDGFEQSELLEPQNALADAGAEVSVISLKAGSIRGWDKKDRGRKVDADLAVKDARAEDLDALLLPGGVINPDLLRRDEDVLRFVRAFFSARKPVSAICHGPWTLIDAGVVKGRKRGGGAPRSGRAAACRRLRRLHRRRPGCHAGTCRRLPSPPARSSPT